MQLFHCPFCGARDEREFMYLAEMGKVRPETEGDISEDEWSKYLYAKRNPRGATREIWMHLPCSEVFGMERDTQTMEVLSTTTFRKDAS